MSPRSIIRLRFGGEFASLEIDVTLPELLIIVCVEAVAIVFVRALA